MNAGTGKSKPGAADKRAEFAPPPFGGASPIEEAYFDNPTHGTAADVFLDIYRNSIVYEFETKTLWERPTGKMYFQPLLAFNTVMRRTLETAATRVLDDRRATEKPSTLYKVYGRALERSRTFDFLRQSSSLACEAVTVPGISWNSTPDVIPTVTSILDFSGSYPVIRNARTDEFFRDPIPTPAEQIVAAGDSPLWGKFMSEIFPNEKTRETARILLSMAIRSKPSKTFQIWHNIGDGAKNTVTDLLKSLLPGRIQSISGSVILVNGDKSERRFASAELESATAAVFDEVGGKFDVPAIKRITSLSAIRVERKGQHPKEIRPTWVPIALTNELPNFTPPDDQAFLSRLIVLPFQSVFYSDEEQRQEYLAQGVASEQLHPAREKTEILSELKVEAPAILRDLAMAAITLRDMYNNRPPESAECRAARRAYRTANDDDGKFVSEHFTRDPDGFVPNDRLEHLYKEFTGDPRPKMRRLRADLVRRFTFIEIGSGGTGGNRKRGLIGIREITEKDYSNTANDSDDETPPWGFGTLEQSNQVSPHEEVSLGDQVKNDDVTSQRLKSDNDPDREKWLDEHDGELF